MQRVFIHVTEQGTHADQVEINEATNLLAHARKGELADSFVWAKAKLDIEQADSGTIFQLGGCPMEETCPTLIVMDIY